MNNMAIVVCVGTNTKDVSAVESFIMKQYKTKQKISKGWEKYFISLGKFLCCNRFNHQPMPIARSLRYLSPSILQFQRTTVNIRWCHSLIKLHQLQTVKLSQQRWISQNETHPILLAAPDAATAILVAIDILMYYLFVDSSYRLFLQRDCSRLQQEQAKRQ